MGVGVAVAVAVGVEVLVDVAVAVALGVEVFVDVAVAVGVGGGLSDPSLHALVTSAIAAKRAIYAILIVMKPHNRSRRITSLSSPRYSKIHTAARLEMIDTPANARRLTPPSLVA
jgi:hypothetical protein